jgi:hypothetical protein
LDFRNYLIENLLAKNSEDEAIKLIVDKNPLNVQVDSLGK